MNNESERSYQRQYEACRKAEQRGIHLLDFVPYPMAFKLNGRVNYVNQAFTEMFGWTLDELAGKRIPYVPPDLVEETGKGIKKPIREKYVRRFETRRLTKDGRVLHVAVRVASFSGGAADADAELVILRDLTRERRAARNNEVLLRISTALPAYPELEKLLDYISNEIRVIINTEVALVILLSFGRDRFCPFLPFQNNCHPGVAIF